MENTDVLVNSKMTELTDITQQGDTASLVNPSWHGKHNVSAQPDCYCRRPGASRRLGTSRMGKSEISAVLLVR